MKIELQPNHVSHDWFSKPALEYNGSLMVTGCNRCKCGYVWNSETSERQHHEFKGYLDGLDCDELLVKLVMEK